MKKIKDVKVSYFDVEQFNSDSPVPLISEYEWCLNYSCEVVNDSNEKLGVDSVFIKNDSFDLLDKNRITVEPQEIGDLSGAIGLDNPILKFPIEIEFVVKFVNEEEISQKTVILK